MDPAQAQASSCWRAGEGSLKGQRPAAEVGCTLSPCDWGHLHHWTRDNLAHVLGTP